jgi:hypothetical protein
MLRKLILTTAAATLIAAPLAAQAAPVRMSSPVAEAEQLSEELMLLLGAVGFALLVLILSNSGDSDTAPTSP